MDLAIRDRYFESYTITGSDTCFVINRDFAGGFVGGSGGYNQCLADSIQQHYVCKENANYIAYQGALFTVFLTAAYTVITGPGGAVVGGATAAAVTYEYSRKINVCDRDKALRDLRCG